APGAGGRHWIDRSVHAATVHVIGDKMKGPVFTTFKPGTKDLFVAELGERFDANEGQILKITGF
ncbi:MAG: hypothetical protein HY720_15505, partial [Planctomycetes bacterium]|nr:hypothetical protein [Planctomycetota bacterium]